MKILELFAGSRSIGKAADRRGWRCFSVDIEPFKNIDLVADINEINVRDIPFVPDVVWASPPCTTFSVLALARHWTPTHWPKTDAAVGGVQMVLNTLRVISFFSHANPRLKFYIENPRGKLRKLSFMNAFPRATVTYCKYGDTRMKPTDIWTNNLRSPKNPLGWSPRRMCFGGNPNCRHEQCPRSSHSCGTAGLLGSYERSKVPAALCREVLDAAFSSLGRNDGAGPRRTYRR